MSEREMAERHADALKRLAVLRERLARLRCAIPRGSVMSPEYERTLGEAERLYRVIRDGEMRE